MKFHVARAAGAVGWSFAFSNADRNVALVDLCVCVCAHVRAWCVYVGMCGCLCLCVCAGVMDGSRYHRCEGILDGGELAAWSGGMTDLLQLHLTSELHT